MRPHAFDRLGFFVKRVSAAGFFLVSVFCLGNLQAENWAKKAPWNDGRAEVVVYDAEIPTAQGVRLVRETVITSASRDRASRRFSAVLNRTLEFTNFPQHQFVSISVSESDFSRVEDLVVQRHDWQGTTWTRWREGRIESGGAPQLSTVTTLSISPNEKDFFEDQLILTLRDVPLKEGFEKKIRLIPSFLNGPAAPAAQDAALHVEALESAYTRAGAIESWRVAVVTPSGKDMYWIEKKEPHLLIKMETHRGEKRSLYGRSRWSFWDPRLPRPGVLK